ncbi:MAG: membrane protein insertase YidC [Saprospirales bacterium]|nr:membrane protein insertase YidC [Saprospirales bacterium]
MDRNAIIGFVLIFAILLAWQQFMPKPDKTQKDASALTDSTGQIPLIDTSLVESPDAASGIVSEIPDSVRIAQMGSQYGIFAPALVGEETTHVLENELIRVTISSKGGRIVEADLKQYKKISEGERNKEIESPLLLLEDPKNRFEYLLPLAGTPARIVSTQDLFFDVQSEGETLIFRANAGDGRFFEQRYSLKPGSYEVDHSISWAGLESFLDPNSGGMTLNWVNYLDKLEKNVSYERNYTTVYFKPSEATPDYCSCTRSDEEAVPDTPIKWISNVNQFFNSSLIAETAFKSGVFTTEVLTEPADDLKKLQSRVVIPTDDRASFDMAMYIGPNEFKRLHAYNMELEDVIPFGRSIFGTINRWVIRPIFTFLSSFIGSMGVVILVLTLIVKMLLFPLTYKMIHSQSKMGALKPQLASLREKFKDDPQKQQMETMKVYNEHGVNPLGGCLPTVLQMPIWFALYRFFPASIEFRQVPFLWATDLSSYDVAFSLPFVIPFYGDHVSLFTLLWAGTTVLYTYYNAQNMDMSMNPAMKYMQYFMPLMFLFFFNNFAAGLTCYLLFSNLINVGQTIITKNYLISEDRIKEGMEAYKKKPKKKEGFSSRLQSALKEQQKKAAEAEAKRPKGKK